MNKEYRKTFLVVMKYVCVYDIDCGDDFMDVKLYTNSLIV